MQTELPTALTSVCLATRSRQLVQRNNRLQSMTDLTRYVPDLITPLLLNLPRLPVQLVIELVQELGLLPLQIVLHVGPQTPAIDGGRFPQFLLLPQFVQGQRIPKTFNVGIQILAHFGLDFPLLLLQCLGHFGSRKNMEKRFLFLSFSVTDFDNKFRNNNTYMLMQGLRPDQPTNYAYFFSKMSSPQAFC